MNKEEAIRILSSETSMGAVTELRQKMNDDKEAVVAEIQKAMDMGADALRNDSEGIKEQNVGRWITTGKIASRCSICNYLPMERTKFCPNCGAKMEIETEAKMEKDDAR